MRISYGSVRRLGGQKAVKRFKAFEQKMHATIPAPVAPEDVRPTPEQIKKCLRRVSTARLTVASFCRFFGHLILKTEAVCAMPEHGVPTAAVTPDGTVYYNPDFVETLTNPELCGLVIHETMHPALLCWRRQGSRKAKVEDDAGNVFDLWNLAHDYSFNPEIEELANKCRAKGKIKLPPRAANKAEYKGMSAERIYDLIWEEAKKNGKGKGGKVKGKTKGGKAGA